jgi:hypothetical protein
MANTTTITGNFIAVTGLDADWDGMAECTGLLYDQNLGAMKVASIRFDPSAIADIMVIKEGSATGPVIFQKQVASLSDNTPFYYAGRRMRPFIDIGDCTLGVAANAAVVIELAD